MELSKYLGKNKKKNALNYRKNWPLAEIPSSIYDIHQIVYIKKQKSREMGQRKLEKSVNLLSVKKMYLEGEGGME